MNTLPEELSARRMRNAPELTPLFWLPYYPVIQMEVH